MSSFHSRATVCTACQVPLAEMFVPIDSSSTLLSSPKRYLPEPEESLNWRCVESMRWQPYITLQDVTVEFLALKVQIQKLVL